MISVTYNGTTYECARAVKGVSYVKLYDESNILIADFEGVSDFSLFTISGGSWESGRSNQRVSAAATLSRTSLTLTLDDKVIVEDGLSVTFTAPEGSQNITEVNIDSQSYSFVTPTNEVIGELFDCFSAGAKVEIILSVVNGVKKAYLQSGVRILDDNNVVPVEYGGTGADNEWDARSNLGLGLKSTTLDAMESGVSGPVYRGSLECRIQGEVCCISGTLSLTPRTTGIDRETRIIYFENYDGVYLPSPKCKNFFIPVKVDMGNAGTFVNPEHMIFDGEHIEIELPTGDAGVTSSELYFNITWMDTGSVG